MARRLFLALLTIVAAHGLWLFVLHNPWTIAPLRGVDASYDEMAVRHFGAASIAPLKARLMQLPPKEVLMVVGPGNDWTLAEARYLVACLAWPRPVWSLGIMPDGGQSRFSSLPASVEPTTLLFYKVAPPELAEVVGGATEKFGERLQLVTPQQ